MVHCVVPGVEIPQNLVTCACGISIDSFTYQSVQFFVVSERQLFTFTLQQQKYKNAFYYRQNRLCALLVVTTQNSSVLFFSRPRSEGWPWMYFLHLSLSSDILTDSSTDSPVHVLMLSIQAVRGLPRLRAPDIMPCIISFSRHCFLIVWP